MPVAVTGLRDLQAAFAKADRDTRLGVRQELRQVAEPIRSDAEQFAGSRIRNIGTKWPKMRTGVTRRLVYVAPRQRGVKVKGGTVRSRPNLGALLMDRAMQPALQGHQPRLEREVEQMLDRVCDRFNHGGGL